MRSRPPGQGCLSTPAPWSSRTRGGRLRVDRPVLQRRCVPSVVAFVQNDAGQVRWVAPADLSTLDVHPTMRLRIERELDGGKWCNRLGRQRQRPSPLFPVVTGLIGSVATGSTATLGRWPTRQATHRAKPTQIRGMPPGRQGRRPAAPAAYGSSSCAGGSRLGQHGRPAAWQPSSVRAWTPALPGRWHGQRGARTSGRTRCAT